VAPPVVGAPPTPQQKAAFAAAANLSPEKSLLRIQELAKFVFSSVGVIATLLTGLGLFTDLGKVLENSWAIGDVPLPVAFAGTSLFCASCAIWPKMSSVDLADLNQVESWYRRQIVRRGIWMILSLALFSLAILCATFTGVGVDEAPSKPSIFGSWKGPAKEATARVGASAEAVPDDWAMVTIMRGREHGGRWKTLFHDWSRPNGSGELAVEGEVQADQRFGKIVAIGRLYSESEERNLESESAMVLRRGHHRKHHGR
jgi:hypothetical protein